MAKLLSFAFEVDSIHMSIGSDQKVKINGVYDDQSTGDITSQLTLSSSSPSIATVDSAGTIHAVKAGTALIEATGTINNVSSGGNASSSTAASGKVSSYTQSSFNVGSPGSAAFNSNEGGSQGWSPPKGSQDGYFDEYCQCTFTEPILVDVVRWRINTTTNSITSITVLENGVWKSVPTQIYSGGTLLNREATVQKTCTAIRIHISGSGTSGATNQILNIATSYMMWSVQSQTSRLTVVVDPVSGKLTVVPNGNPDGTEYYIERDTVQTFPNPVVISNWSPNKEVIDAGSGAGPFYYRIKARNAKRIETGWGTSFKAGVEAIRNLKITATYNRISLSWDVDPGATSYQIYKGSMLVYNGTDPSYLDPNLTPDTVYHYRIAAVGLYGAGEESINDIRTLAQPPRLEAL